MERWSKRTIEEWDEILEYLNHKKSNMRAGRSLVRMSNLVVQVKEEVTRLKREKYLNDIWWEDDQKLLSL